MEPLAPQVRAVVRVSLVINIILSGLNMYATIKSGSLAVLASLVDTLLDLVSQIVLTVTEIVMRKPSDKDFPVGRTRIEVSAPLTRRGAWARRRVVC
jgi:divalent metal cation (Fe/Co/Zn/Cd) transporter